jgi:S-adenosylmethionine:tRNA ribosyltransferase-isomerase
VDDDRLNEMTIERALKEPADARLSDFDYLLPAERIAQTPLPVRDQSRLLVMSREGGRVIGHKHFFDLPEYLEPGDLLVLNETRVNALRLLGRRETGGQAEVFLTHRIAEGLWQALVRPGKHLQVGARVDFENGLAAEIVGRADERGGRTVKFSLARGIGAVEDEIERQGRTPLPPYIEDDIEQSEDRRREIKSRYQTIYAHDPGSAAAPTAGLHFTEALIEGLERKGVRIAKITLHVGVGTFRPIVSEDIREHTMHAESVSISQETAQMVAEAKGRIVAVGTTSLRALESAADGARRIRAGQFETSLYITPGYRFQVVDSLITNFHMPRSTLLVLVAAFAGREAVLASYNEAMRAGYRFLSFGDAMLIISERASSPALDFV